MPRFVIGRIDLSALLSVCTLLSCGLLSCGLLSCGLVGCSLTGRMPSAADQPDSSGEKFLGELAGGSLLGTDPPPQSEEPVGLYTITPYDPAKIPVVLVHGLSNDSADWEPLLSQLGKDAQIVHNYQFWKFLYPTDSSVMKSAADLRASLNDALQQLDRNRQNRRLSKIVLIGHGVGGLLAKLQAAHSDDQLWNAVSQLPIEDQALEPTIRSVVRQTFYFEPQPMVGAVIQIGLPDEVAKSAEGSESGLGGRLKQFPQSVKVGYQRIVGGSGELLLDRNTGLPSQETELSPQSPILKATDQLRHSDRVTFHSIIHRANEPNVGSQADSGGVTDVNGNDVVQVTYVVPGPRGLHQAETTIRSIRQILIGHLPPTP